jgi:WD40 repeat protein
VLSGSIDNTIRLWDTITGECVCYGQGRDIDDKSFIDFVCFSPDGKLELSIGKKDEQIRIWDLANAKQTGILESVDDLVISALFSPDGKQVLSCGETIRLWDLASGKCIRAIAEKQPYVIQFVCFSPDSKLVLAGYRDNTLKIWNLATEECILTLEGHFNPGSMISICFGSDGKTIYAAFSDYGKNSYILVLDLEFDLSFPGWQDWDEGARPYLEIFLALHPNWTKNDFNNILIPDLQNRGYGWLRPEGPRKKLEEMGRGNI